MGDVDAYIETLRGGTMLKVRTYSAWPPHRAHAHGPAPRTTTRHSFLFFFFVAVGGGGARLQCRGAAPRRWSAEGMCWVAVSVADAHMCLWYAPAPSSSAGVGGERPVREGKGSAGQGVERPACPLSGNVFVHCLPDPDPLFLARPFPWQTCIRYASSRCCDKSIRLTVVRAHVQSTSENAPDFLFGVCRSQSVGMCMDSSTISWSSSELEGTSRTPIICLWATTSTEGTTVSRRCHCSSL